MFHYTNHAWLRHNVRSISTGVFCCACHYDVLGLTPKATQSDIKSAYYKLSMTFHPDKNKGKEAAQRFRDISAAYEILGNVRLKKLYDKGVISNTGLGTSYPKEEEPDDPSLKFYKSRSRMHTVPTMYGKTPIYDFDSWSKHHYGKTFQIRKKNKQTVDSRAVKEKDERDYVQKEVLLYFMVSGIALLIMMMSKPDFDRVVSQKPSAEKNKVVSD